MMRVLHSHTTRITALVSILLLATGVAGVHAAQFDSPSMTIEVTDRSSARLQVTAGTSGAPAGFKVEWMTKINFDAMGGFPAAPFDPVIISAEFHGTPTLTISGGNSGYQLAPNEGTVIEIGDLFDETGVTTEFTAELEPGTEYVFRARTLGDGVTAPSEFAPALFLNTDPIETDCTYTQGYWKNHPGAWPVGGLFLGNVYYDASQLLAIFNSPAAGNGLIFLAHQLIAAKLNVANGASNTDVQMYIDDADALIGDLLIPPVGAGYIAPKDASPLTEILDQFNNGDLGVPHCGVVQIDDHTWGGIKGIYR
jgi:hypothetical protein